MNSLPNQAAEIGAKVREFIRTKREVSVISRSEPYFDALGEKYFFGCHFSAMGQCFHTSRDGFAQPVTVFSVDLVGGPEGMVICLRTTVSEL